MVYATYARPWYQDPVNFIKAAQQRLVFEPTFLQSMAEDVRPLFSHVREALLPGERLRGCLRLVRHRERPKPFAPQYRTYIVQLY